MDGDREGDARETARLVKRSTVILNAKQRRIMAKTKLAARAARKRAQANPAAARRDHYYERQQGGVFKFAARQHETNSGAVAEPEKAAAPPSERKRVRSVSGNHADRFSALSPNFGPEGGWPKGKPFHGIKPRKRLPVMSPSMKEKQKIYVAEKRIWRSECIARDGYHRCEWINKDGTRCKRTANKDPHHAAGRIGKNLYDRKKFKASCNPHHRYAHEHAKEAEQQGFIIREYEKHERPDSPSAPNGAHGK